ALVLGISGAALVGRLAYLQIIQHDQYVTEAQSVHDGERELPAHRGTILDRLGNPLAISLETFNVLVDRKVWSEPAVGRRAAEQLAPLVNRSAGELYGAVGAQDSGSEVVALDLPYQQGREIITKGIPGVIVEPASHRIYPEGNIAASILGFTGRDGHGLSGLELDIEDALNGEPGRLLYERDSLGNPIAFGYRQESAPTPGGDVVLTLDRTIQRMIERELDDAIRRTKATGGTIIVQEPSTGAILAMASRPSFDLTHLDLSDTSQTDLYRNRAVTDQYEPGSVFKLVTMAAAIDAGKVNANTTYVDTGETVVGERVFANWDFSVNGTTTMTNVLVRSLNTGTVWLADKILGSETFYRYVRAFGFGEPTGSGFSGEGSGSYRLPTEENWFRADLAANSFGQGLSATPLQVLNMVSTLANGGTVMRPYIVREVRGDSGTTATEPQATGRAVSEASAATLREMMRQVLEANYLAHVPGYSAGGKSGTAYVPQGASDTRGDAYKAEVTIPSYVGFAPLNNPRISILVKLDNLGSADFGGTLTAPIFSRLAHNILTYLRVPPDRPETLNRTPPPTPTPAPSR
ncbi:MAG: peptidoglycan D,D-transpeptidase FtsI family protein, partial [Dehalococcoidia bacterium]